MSPVSRGSRPVGPLRADPGTYGLPAGYTATIWSPQVEPMVDRVLDATAVRRALGAAPVPLGVHPALLQVLTDLSGSMWGGNDAAGLRHEALLVLAEHLAVASRRGRTPWYLEVISFDTSSPFDLGPVPLERKRRKELATHLLAKEAGGSSCLGPSLAIAEATTWRGPIARCVLSDFELFDADVPSVLHRFLLSPADVSMAVVFRSPVPAVLAGSDAVVHAVDPSRDKAEAVALCLWDAVKVLAGQAVAA